MRIGYPELDRHKDKVLPRVGFVPGKSVTTKFSFSFRKGLLNNVQGRLTQ